MFSLVTSLEGVFFIFSTIFLASYKYLMIFSKVECSEDKTMRTTKNQQNISIDKLILVYLGTQLKKVAKK